MPRPPDSKGSLSLIHVARTLNPEYPVNLVSTVSAIATNDAVQTGFDCSNGVHGFAKDPHLDHVAGFPVVAGGGKARRDDNPLGVFVENKSVAHRVPPRVSMRATSAIRMRKPKAARGPWNLGGMRSFIGFVGSNRWNVGGSCDGMRWDAILDFKNF